MPTAKSTKQKLPKVVPLGRTLPKLLYDLEKQVLKEQILQKQARARRSSPAKQTEVHGVGLSEYQTLVQRCLKVGDLEEDLLIHAFCLYKRALKLTREEVIDLKSNDFICLFTICVYLSIKVLIDVEKWFLEDFSFLCGMEVDLIEELELAVVNDILKYSVLVKEQEFFEEKEKLLSVRRHGRRSTKKKSNGPSRRSF